MRPWHFEQSVFPHGRDWSGIGNGKYSELKDHQETRRAVALFGHKTDAGSCQHCNTSGKKHAAVAN